MEVTSLSGALRLMYSLLIWKGYGQELYGLYVVNEYRATDGLCSFLVFSVTTPVRAATGGELRPESSCVGGGGGRRRIKQI